MYTRKLNQITDRGAAQISPSLLKIAYFLPSMLGRGFGLANRLVFSILPSESSERCIVSIGTNTKFEFLCSDKYWNLLFLPNYKYEPDLFAVFKKISHLKYNFIDAGANFGYWSALLSSRDFGEKKVVAVEVDTSNFKSLKRNQELNDWRFETIQNGILDVDETYIEVSDGHHSTRHIVSSRNEEAVNPSGEAITSKTIKTIVNEFFDPVLPLVVKLDVEGVEIEAVKGAYGLDFDNCVFIYEEHGKDKNHATTKALMEDLNFECYFILDTGDLIPVYDLRVLDKLKKNKFRGYNSIAISNHADESGFARRVLYVLQEAT